MTRRILLRAGVMLETGDGVSRLIAPTYCPICRQKVTADGDRNHAITVPSERADVQVVVDRCHGRDVAGRV